MGESGGEREHEREATSDDDDEERKSHKGQEGMMKVPYWGVKAAYGRVTPHYGTLRSIIRFVSRFR